MAQKCWHGIVLDTEFIDPQVTRKYKTFAQRKSKTNPWTLIGIEIQNNQFDNAINEIQTNLKADEPYYVHFYNDDELIVIFKEKVIRVKPDKSTWGPIIAFGETLSIPEAQLDFWPNRFQDEIHYFEKADFI